MRLIALVLLLFPCLFVWSIVKYVHAQSVVIAYTTAPDCNPSRLLQVTQQAPLSDSPNTSAAHALCEVQPMTVIQKRIVSFYGRGSFGRHYNYATLQDRSGTHYQIQLSDYDFSVYFPLYTDVIAQFFHGKIVMIADGTVTASTPDYPADILDSQSLLLFVTGLFTCFDLCVLIAWVQSRRTPVTPSEKAKAWAALYKIQPPR